MHGAESLVKSWKGPCEVICALEAITEAHGVSCSTVLLQCGSGPRSRHVNSPSQTTGMYVSLLSDSSKLQAMMMFVLAPVRPQRRRRSLVQAGRCFIYLALFAVGNLGTPTSPGCSIRMP